MKKFVLSLVSLLAVVLFVSSCNGGKSRHDNVAGDTLRLKYAEHLHIIRYNDYTLVSLDNPWKRGAELHRYVLVPRKDSARVGALPQGTVVYTPVERSVVFTSPHCYLLGLLGAGSVVGGVCDLPYINIPDIQRAAKRGSVVDCGNSMSPSVERMVAIQPQALLVSPFEGASYGQVERLGVPLIECADYMETSALGRAEWMKFYGMLVGKVHEADSLFAAVERGYTDAMRLARKSAVRPKVITERVVSGVWYCPGGKSSMGRLIADAGGRYAFADDSHSGSLTLSPEKVLERAADADCWFFIGSGGGATRSQLLAEYSGYKILKAFKDGNVYECMPSIDNQYFEQISFRPDFLLEDMVNILHPDLKMGQKSRYYRQIR